MQESIRETNEQYNSLQYCNIEFTSRMSWHQKVNCIHIHNNEGYLAHDIILVFT